MDDCAWQLYRNAGTLFIAPADLSETAVQDMLDSILLAQLVASQQQDPFTAAIHWRKTWARTLDRLHWATTASAGQTELYSHSFVIAALLTETSSTLPEADLGLLLAGLQVDQVQALEPYCRRNHAKSTHLRLSVALARSDRLIQLRNLAFETPGQLEDNWMTQVYRPGSHPALPITISSNTLMRIADYAPERHRVIASLGGNRARLIERIPATTRR